MVHQHSYFSLSFGTIAFAARFSISARVWPPEVGFLALHYLSPDLNRALPVDGFPPRTATVEWSGKGTCENNGFFHQIRGRETLKSGNTVGALENPRRPEAAAE